MIEGSSHQSSVLIVETDSSLLESLPQHIWESEPGCALDVCATRECALEKLLASPYQLIISGIHLAEMNDFFLLERAGNLQPLTPVVVTATGADQAAAKVALDRGAFHLLPTPLDPAQVRACLGLVQWQQKLRQLIAIEERARQTYARGFASLQLDPKDSIYRQDRLAAFEKLMETYRDSLKHVEESIRLLTDRVQVVRAQAHAQCL